MKNLARYSSFFIWLRYRLLTLPVLVLVLVVAALLLLLLARDVGARQADGHDAGPAGVAPAHAAVKELQGRTAAQAAGQAVPGAVVLRSSLGGSSGHFLSDGPKSLVLIVHDDCCDRTV